MAETGAGALSGLNVHGPLYKEVERRILQALAEGEWKPGEQLPNEQQLAERFGIAVFTLRAGIGRLVDAGLLIRRQGKGTFVALHSARPARNQFLRIYRNDGTQPRWARELASFEKTRADDETAALLELGNKAADRAILHLRYALRDEGRPVGALDIRLAAAPFAKASADVFRSVKDNIYAVYQDRFGVNVIRIEERAFAALPDRATARLAGITPADPVLVVERTAYTFNDVPVETRRYTLDARGHCYHGTRAEEA